MERPERGTIDAAQKAKLIFFAVAAVVTILLIVSFVVANRARNERDAALKELEVVKEDNTKLSKWLEERTQDLEKHKVALEECTAKLKTKPKAKAPVKSAPAKSAPAKKKSTKSKHK